MASKPRCAARGQAASRAELAKPCIKKAPWFASAANCRTVLDIALVDPIEVVLQQVADGEEERSQRRTCQIAIPGERVSSYRRPLPPTAPKRDVSPTETMLCPRYWAENPQIPWAIVPRGYRHSHGLFLGILGVFRRLVAIGVIVDAKVSMGIEPRGHTVG
jgi:hypothetical protein